MIIGIGVDIVKTARFEGITKSFASRVYTANERAYLLGKSHISAAGLFAAKEAIAKALGTGFTGFWPSQVEITHNELGQPGVVLHGSAEAIAKGLAGGREYSFTLSISHTDSDAIAFVVMCLVG